MNNTISNNLSLGDALSWALKRGNGIPVETNLGPYAAVLERVKIFDLSGLDADNLRDTGSRLKQDARSGQSLDDLLPETFALVREACRRLLNLDPYDEQMIAGIALHQGRLVQARTGEGKTLAAVFPACLNALTGRGVHIFTANDYLARRDAAWMGCVYGLLGLRAAFIDEKTGTAERKDAYKADVTYLTAKQAGFDFLKDGIQYDRSGILQCGYNMVLVDEADFIMIDEARVPMVLAERRDPPAYDPVKIDRAVRTLERDRHFTIDGGFRVCALTAEGEKRIQELLGCGGMHEADNGETYGAVHVSLHARHLLERDVDYVIKNGRIELVDEYTGRIADRRRWPYGIQTALEAREGLAVQAEGSIRGSITVQNFIARYPKIAAMTATAVSAASEFSACYGLATVILPPHRPDRLLRLPDRVFTTRASKMKAVAGETAAAHAAGRPVLIGTTSVRESEELAGLIRGLGISCSVLNARDDEHEAEVVARAGMKGAVTISTNMAGRGTDIKLGGETGKQKEELLRLGGLYVIGTSKHESVRIDNQLRGRAGRQGDPGSSCLFVSLEDDLMVRYGVREFLPKRLRIPVKTEQGEEVPDSRVSREIDRAQKIIERQYSDMRLTLRRYTLMVEKQREHLQSLRLDALLRDELPEDLEPGISADSGNYPGGGKKLACRIFLRLLDDFWTNHLRFIEDLREGIHLQRYAALDPLLVFIQETDKAYEKGLSAVFGEAAEAFRRAASGDPEYDNFMENAKNPGNTWTYLVNDNPFPSFTLSVLGHNNIGSALASGLLLIGTGIGALFTSLSAAVRKLFEKRE